MLDDVLTIFAEVASRIKPIISKWRKELLFLAVTALCIGLGVSIAALEVTLSDLRMEFLLLLVFVLGPVSLIYGAVNMQLTGRAGQVRIPFASSFRISTISQVAEILPIPGGAIVRGAALVQNGSSKGRAAKVVLIVSVMWISLAAAGAGISLWHHGITAWMLAMAGLCGTAFTFVSIARMAGLKVALWSVLWRIMGLGLAACRIFAAVAAIGQTIPARDSLVFAFASITGSASSIAPGGLGISESLAALLATATSVSPAAAFVAVALNRVVGLSVAAVTSAFFYVKPNQAAPSG